MNVVPITRETVEELPSFDDFWLLWPAERRVCKKDARNAWDRIDTERHTEILVALMTWRRFWDSKQEWEFVPHPHRWLQKERWEDALPVELQKQQRVQQQSKDFNQKMDEANAKRSPMPEALRKMIADMKAKR